MKSGIYKITNKITGDSYVGSSENLHRRIRTHKNQIKKGKHSNKFIKENINDNNYIIEIIMDDVIPILLTTFEKFFAIKLKSKYNIKDIPCLPLYPTDIIFQGIKYNTPEKNCLNYYKSYIENKLNIKYEEFVSIVYAAELIKD